MKISKLKILILLFALSLLCFTLISKYIAKVVLPRGAEILHSYAETNMFEILNSTVNEVVEKYSVNNQDFVDIKYSQNGTISSININYMLANKIKSEVSMLISKRLSEQDEMPVYVPIGAFANNMYFMGKGPSIKFILVQRGCVQTDFDHSFESGGINQTIHTLKITLDADVALMLPFYNTNTKMETSAILSQTIINGDCPEQLFKLYEG